MYSFDEFKCVTLLESHIEDFVDIIVEQILNENIKPINEGSDSDLSDKLKAVFSFKIPKLRKALKTYQKDLVDQALNDLDYEKRREAAGKEDPAVKARLDTAHRTKNDQLKARAQADIEKINDIADGNKTVEAIAKTGKIEARIKAAEISYKHADGQEKDALKIRLDNLEQDKNQTLADIKKYQSERTEDEPKPKKQPNVTDEDDPNDGVVTPPADGAVPKPVKNNTTQVTDTPTSTPDAKELEYLLGQIEIAQEKWDIAKEQANLPKADAAAKTKEIDAHKNYIKAKLNLAKVKGESDNVISDYEAELAELEERKTQVNSSGDVITDFEKDVQEAKEKWDEAKQVANIEKHDDKKQTAAKRAELAYYRAEKNLAKAKGEDTSNWDNQIITLSNELKNN